MTFKKRTGRKLGSHLVKSCALRIIKNLGNELTHLEFKILLKDNLGCSDKELTNLYPKIENLLEELNIKLNKVKK